MTSGRPAVRTGSGGRLPRLARVLEVLRVEGVRGVWFKALGDTVYRRVVVMECPLDAPSVRATARADVVVELLTPDGVDDYAAFRPETDPAETRRRLLAGHRCFVARHHAAIVHACWAATRRVWIDYLGRELVLPKDAVYHYDSFTAPAFRGRNISALRVTEAARYFRAAGYGRLVAVVVPENRTAFRPLEKAGYRRVGVMGSIGLARWRRHFYRRKRAPQGSPAYWDEIVTAHRQGTPLEQWRAYMQDVYGRLMRRWVAPSSVGRGMKTDLFEEAVSSHHLLDALGPGSIGLDCSAATVLAARERLRQAEGRHLFVVADLRAIPLRAGAVGHILAGSSLDHFPDKADIAVSLAELARVLRVGGTLVVTFDNPHNPAVWLRNRLPFTWLNRLGVVPYYVGKTYGCREGRAQLESLGLAVTDVTAVAHTVRAPAIWLVALAERLNASRLQRLLGRALAASERLERWPTRYRTGYYLAFRAEKRGVSAPPA